MGASSAKTPESKILGTLKNGTENKIMTKPIIAAVALVVLLGIGLSAWFLTESELTVESTAQHEFTIDEGMPRVRKILVRTNAVKKIVAMADAELLDQKWLDMDIDLGKKILKRDWHVDGQGKLDVVVNNSYLGKINLTLDQSVDIRRERLQVESKLGKSSGAITKYDSNVELTPDESGQAHFKTSLSLVVSTKANFFTRSVVKKNIEAAAADALDSQEQAFREVVKEKEGEFLIVPDQLSK